VTAADLVSRLESLGLFLTVEEDDFVIEGELPDDAVAVVDLLRAPIIAFLTGKRLLAVDGSGRGCTRPDGILDPRERLPANVRMVCVVGGEWDRISPHALEAFPDMFASNPVKNRTSDVARRATVGYTSFAFDRPGSSS
jgi:hypothetical protein